MNSSIKFNRITDYRGRNGSGKQTGIEVLALNDYLVISPTNSKGVTDSCSMRIPVENISQFIELLKQSEPKPEVYHPDLRSDLKMGYAPKGMMRAWGKTQESPESFEIENLQEGTSYIYDSKIEYINDCNFIGINPECRI